MSRKIKTLREKIDKIDEKILSLLNKRIRFVKKIGAVKGRFGMEFFDPAREEGILERISRLNRGEVPSEKLEPIFKEIFSVSRSFEKPIVIAYLGPEGSFTHLASIKHFGNSCDFRPLRKIQDVFIMTEKRECDIGVVPVENSTEGSVGQTLDMLLDANVRICGEIYQEVKHSLVGKNENLTEIKRIYSHPQALAQCRLWLEMNLPGAEIIEITSTSEAAKKASDDESSAAIASSKAAEIYGLKEIRTRIEDRHNNYTRFLVIGRSDSGPTGRDKTSIIISLKDEAGSLHRALSSFAKYRINLSKIESRPMKKRPWEYIFFIDFDSHLNQKTVKKALLELGKVCLFLKVLGSYPRSR